MVSLWSRWSATFVALLSLVCWCGSGRCPNRNSIKPCTCSVDPEAAAHVVNVTCLHARTWYHVREVLRLFRGEHRFIQLLHIENVQDVHSDTLMRGIFRHLHIEQLMIKNCLMDRWRKDVFVNTTVYSLSIVSSHLKRIPTRPLTNVRTIQEASFVNNQLSSLGHRSLTFGVDELALLDFKHNMLESVPRRALQMVPKLEILVLSHNLIRSVSREDFCKLTNLVALELSHNPLVHIAADAFVPLMLLKHIGLAGILSQDLPAALQRILRRLISLDVSNASVHISTLIERQGTSTLESLVAQVKTDLSVIDLVNLTSLVDLDIRGSRQGQRRLSETMRGGAFGSVERLDISETEIALSSLSVFPNVRVVFMNHNPTVYLDNKLIRPISRISVLHMEHCEIRQISAYALWPLRLTLRELNLSYNKLRHLNWRSLFPLATLKSLDLSYNEFRDRWGATRRRNRTRHSRRARGFASFPLNRRLLPPSIEVLSLAGNGLQRIPERLTSGLLQLKHLNLAGNELRSVQLELRVNRKLAELNLNNNRISYVHPTAFEQLRRLRHLNLGWNPIGDIGAVRFPPRLEYLGLTRCLLKIVDSRSLASLANLYHLDLSYNGLRTINVNATSGLPSSLVYLDLEGNPLDCSCQLMPFIDWLSDHVVTLSTFGTICYTPASLRYLHPVRDMCWSTCQPSTTGRQWDSSLFCKPIVTG
uniref:LRRCT domain-containing protein n=1 Tax=Trichuris muris TaxID=70415 RepID=A0A5S6QVM3_TRIMR